MIPHKPFAQIRLISQATGIAILITLAIILLRIFMAGQYDNYNVLAVPGLTYIVVGGACLLVAWRSGLKLWVSWIVGYLYFWVALVFLDLNFAINAFNRSGFTLIVLLTISPYAARAKLKG
jgi:hypothetical protein